MSINTNYAKGLVQNYANNQWQIINANFEQRYGIKDSRSVWIGLEALKSFIQEVETTNQTDKTTTGIRIYFGAYSQDVPSPISATYDHLHTLLMISTYTGADGKNYDYDATTGSSDFSQLAAVSAMNHGHLCPPPFNTSGQDNMYEQGTLFMAYADGYTAPQATQQPR